MDRINELKNEIEASVGFRVQAELDFLSANFYVFEKNYQQFKKFLLPLKGTKNLLDLWNEKNRSKFNLTLNEITRLLLNFLSSATSLISVTRNSVPKWYQNTSFSKEYETRKNALANDLECKFVEDLRNYTHHYQLPYTQGVMQFNPENGLTGKFVLSIDNLQNWDGWAKGKGYLKHTTEDIEIEILIDSYYGKIFEFHKWIFNTIQQINAFEINEVTEKQKELVVLLGKIFETD